MTAAVPLPASVDDQFDALKGLIATLIEQLGGNSIYVTARALADPDQIREMAAWFRGLPAEAAQQGRREAALRQGVLERPVNTDDAK